MQAPTDRQSEVEVFLEELNASPPGSEDRPTDSPEPMEPARALRLLQSRLHALRQERAGIRVELESLRADLLETRQRLQRTEVELGNTQWYLKAVSLQNATNRALLEDVYASRAWRLMNRLNSARSAAARWIRFQKAAN
jgi:hypothetical protein